MLNFAYMPSYILVFDLLSLLNFEVQSRAWVQAHLRSTSHEKPNVHAKCTRENLFSAISHITYNYLQETETSKFPERHVRLISHTDIIPFSCPVRSYFCTLYHTSARALANHAHTSAALRSTSRRGFCIIRYPRFLFPHFPQ